MHAGSISLSAVSFSKETAAGEPEVRVYGHMHILVC
jgi:hypothetical protein